MSRIAIKLEYLGDKFHGSQLQGELRTVQKEVEDALAKIYRQPIRLGMSGRTDAGVHASCQIAHYQEPGTIDIEKYGIGEKRLGKLLLSLNGIMGSDIAARAAAYAPEGFHSRFSAIGRHYVYRILNHQQRSPLHSTHHTHIHRSLRLEPMQVAALDLLGKHDFNAFRSTNADETSTICTVNRAEILKLGEGRLEFHIQADHFVYNMVRIIVGTLIEIGLGKREPESLSRALASLDRNAAGPTAPAKGLTLNGVDYPEQYQLFR